MAFHSYHGPDCMPDPPPTAHDAEHTGDSDRPDDPVRARREAVRRWSLLANRVGYLFVALAVALFFVALAVGLSPTFATLVIVSLVIGCVLLAPSIVIGYAVKAAEREDRERGL